MESTQVETVCDGYVVWMMQWRFERTREDYDSGRLLSVARHRFTLVVLVMFSWSGSGLVAVAAVVPRRCLCRPVI